MTSLFATPTPSENEPMRRPERGYLELNLEERMEGKRKKQNSECGGRKKG